MLIPALDRLRSLALNTRSLTVAVALLASSPAVAEEKHGAELPAGSREVEPGRFVVGMSWDSTLKWLDKRYPRSVYERIEVINSPGVRALHLRNPRKGKWEGINVYEHGGRVKMYVLEATK